MSAGELSPQTKELELGVLWKRLSLGRPVEQGLSFGGNLDFSKGLFETLFLLLPLSFYEAELDPGPPCVWVAVPQQFRQLLTSYLCFPSPGYGTPMTPVEPAQEVKPAESTRQR